MDSAPYHRTRGHHHGLNPSGRGGAQVHPGSARRRPPVRCGIPEPYTLRLSRRIPAQPGYSREGEGGPYPENFGRVPRERLSAPRLPGVLKTARGAGIVWVPCGVPLPRVPVGGPERSWHHRRRRARDGAGSEAARPAFPGREFQSHLTVPLRRLNELTTLHSTWCVGECAAAPGI